MRGAVLGAVSANERQAGVSEASTLLSSAEEPSGFVRMLVILLYSLPVLLIIAACVPLDFAFVPYRIAVGWEEIRVLVAFCGLALLVVEGCLYLLTH